MPYKDPGDKKNYQREYMRQKRAGQGKGDKTKGKTLDPEDIKTAQGLRDTLADTIAEVKATEADPFVRARCIGYLVGIALKAVETADLEERIRQLEADLEDERTFKDAH